MASEVARPGPTSFGVRDELESLLERDLLGPWDGPTEELPPGMIPAERYLLGRLVPRVPDDGATFEAADDAEFAEPDLVDHEIVLDDEQAEEREPEAAVRSGSMASTAIGLSFFVPDVVTTLQVEASWGRYEQAPSAHAETEQGRPKVVWHRRPVSGVMEVPLDVEGDAHGVPDPETEGVVLTWTVGRRHLGRGWAKVVHLALVNRLPVLTSTPDANRLYQTVLQVTALDGHAPIFLGHNDPDVVDPNPSKDLERAHLELLHRRARRFATADPYQTLVGYFTSTRQLASTRRLVDDDISERLSRQDARTRRRRPNVTELTSRMPSSRIAATLGEVEREFDVSSDTTAALDTFRGLSTQERAALPPANPRAVDVLLATSMLQVGVDVPRLGLMLVHGQPKNTAEYIQATSRVGRDRRRPGLVLALYHWSRPRDLAHYESFGYDHATFGMRVEGVTTTPFSDRALDRGLSAILVAAMRHSTVDGLPNVAAHTVDLNGSVADELIEELARRAALVTDDTMRADEVRRTARNRLDLWRQRRGKLAEGRLGYAGADGVTGLLVEPGRQSWDVWSAPMSLREVEPEILLQLDGPDRSLVDAPAWDYWEVSEKP